MGSTSLEQLTERCNGVVDFYFSTGELDTYECSDAACVEKVASRGHMSPVKHNSWSLSLCSASMMFLNVFPSRQPFDGEQWADRESNIKTHLSTQPANSSIWSVVGVSKESDGTIVSQRLGLGHQVAVPRW